MSRGIEIIDTVLPTGSSDTTIIVSVRRVFRPTPESTPMMSTFWRGTRGAAEGEADGPAEPSGTDGAARDGSGSPEADAVGSHAPAVIGEIGMIRSASS